MSSSNAFNTQSQDTPITGKQQQPGYLEKAFNLASSTASNAYNSFSSPTDGTTDRRNQQPLGGGVGAKVDADMSKLPGERANSNPFASGGSSESFENRDISDPNSIQQRLNARDPPNPYPEGQSGANVPLDEQSRNQHDNFGGVGDLGTRSDADVVRLPEERANPNPFSSTTGNSNTALDNSAMDTTDDSNNWTDNTAGGATGNAATPNINAPQDTTTSATPGTNFSTSRNTSDSQSHSWRPNQKSWDTGKVVGTMHDITQHGHSGGITGSNIDTDHGLGMPHRVDNERGNRDEGAIDQQGFAGATDFSSGREGAFNADTRDQGVTDRVQAPVGVDDNISGRDDRAFDRQQDVAGGTGFQSDRGLGDRTQTPVGATPRSDDRAFNDNTSTGATTDSQFGRQGRFDDDSGRDAMDEDEEDDDGFGDRDNDASATSPTGKSRPSKRDKLRGKIMVAKGKLTKDDEAIAQGRRLQAEGITVDPNDFTE